MLETHCLGQTISEVKLMEAKVVSKSAQRTCIGGHMGGWYGKKNRM